MNVLHVYNLFIVFLPKLTASLIMWVNRWSHVDKQYNSVVSAASVFLHSPFLFSIVDSTSVTKLEVIHSEAPTLRVLSVNIALFLMS